MPHPCILRSALKEYTMQINDYGISVKLYYLNDPPIFAPQHEVSTLTAEMMVDRGIAAIKYLKHSDLFYELCLNSSFSPSGYAPFKQSFWYNDIWSYKLTQISKEDRRLILRIALQQLYTNFPLIVEEIAYSLHLSLKDLANEM